MQRTFLPLLAALASCAYAETTSSATTSVIDIILPMLDDQAVMGSIVSVDATATSYYLTCPTGESSTDCGLGNGIQVVEGPSVLEVHLTESSVGTIDVSCDIASNTASCTTSMTTLDITMSNSDYVSSMVTTSGTAVVTDISSYSLAVTVTAGLEKLSDGGSSSGATATSTGGVPRMTQNAFLAGAAMMVGGAMFI